ncbi:MAG: STAS domain-containing protein [Thiopseudomonas sp.]|nr:STAS domain-containing protein [Thiopseudomonas sp.]MCK9465923.1 STAS domain-containing protein [Thiopseudomonas sp.]
MSQIALSDTGCLILSGVLDYRTGTTLREQGKKLLEQSTATHIQVDCLAIEKSSSVGIALLLAFMRDAQRLNKTLSIVNLSQDMQKIAHVSELMPVLPIRN